MYNIFVVYECLPGKRQAFIERVNAEGIADEVRKENGCVRYDYYLSEKNPDEILLIEAWETKEHQQIHVEQPHMEKFKGFKNDYVKATTLSEFELK